MTERLRIDSLHLDLKACSRCRGTDRELEEAEEPAPAPCCPPAEQRSCCDPADKAECCGGASEDGCGCR